MEYRTPTFNLTCNIWWNGGPPAAPNVADADCQLYVPTKTGIIGYPANYLTYQLEVFVRLPKGTDVRPATSDTVKPLIECPAGSGMLYKVKNVVDAHKGFPNEYRIAVCSSPDNPPLPIP